MLGEHRTRTGSTMRRITLRQRLQYLFDGFMSGGTSAMLVALAVATFVIVLVAATLVALTNTAPEGQGFAQLLWMGFMRTIDSGTITGDSGSPFFVLMMLLVTIGGLFVLGALIGILNTGLESRLEQLRKGRSLVLEHDHTLILGWNPQIFTIVSELIIANESRSQGAAVVILADQDKVEMEDAIRDRIPDTRNTRIVCRSGSPVDLTDLEIGNPHAARAIIILPQGDDPDTHVIKSVLAITNNPARREEPYAVVTQIGDPRNLDVVRMIGARDSVLPILANDLIARVAAQTSRQSGLSVIYTELLDFGGDEIYVHREPSLAGRTFGDALSAFDRCTVMGIRSADGATRVNPPMGTVLADGDELVVIAEDDSRIRATTASPPPASANLIRDARESAPARPESALILGWNRAGATIVRELDDYVAPGSVVHVVANTDAAEDETAQVGSALKNQTVTFQHGDIRDRGLLEGVGARDYDHVIVLAYSELGAQEADAITLVTLLHLRDIAERDETPFSIVSEMLDVRNRELAEATRVDDFIVSEHLISLMMAQLSENPALAAVFDDIFDSAGSEIYLKSMSDYVETGVAVDLHTVREAARRRSEVFLGYRLASESHDAAVAYGVHLNPPSSASMVFSADDRIVVLAEG